MPLDSMTREKSFNHADQYSGNVLIWIGLLILLLLSLSFSPLIFSATAPGPPSPKADTNQQDEVVSMP
jgi:hypothetical protein